MIKGVPNTHLGPIWNLQMYPIPQTSFLVGTFFAVSYSKLAVVIEVVQKNDIIKK
jgi:hypothetical protein